LKNIFEINKLVIFAAMQYVQIAAMQYVQIAAMQYVQIHNDTNLMQVFKVKKKLKKLNALAISISDTPEVVTL